MAGESQAHRYKHLPTIVKAFRLSCPITVQTPEGPRGGNTGDWFVFDGVDGRQYIVSDTVFRASYEPVNDDDES